MILNPTKCMNGSYGTGEPALLRGASEFADAGASTRRMKHAVRRCTEL